MRVWICWSVNNAGTINKNNKLWEVPEEEFEEVMDTNVKGTANVLRHFIPLMIEWKKAEGIIVNMSSGWGRSGAALVAPYCASKWAIEGLSKSVAKEVGQGMAVVALNPGVIHTDMLSSCFGTSASLYQSPHSWALKAATLILNLTPADNGASLTVWHPSLFSFYSSFNFFMHFFFQTNVKLLHYIIHVLIYNTLYPPFSSLYYSFLERSRILQEFYHKLHLHTQKLTLNKFVFQGL